MPCPDGLNSGIGLPPPRQLAICQIRSSFGSAGNGREIIAPGTGMLFYNRGASSYVITSGHNLYSPVHDRKAVSAQLFFGRTGQSWSTKRSMRHYWVCDEFVGSSHPEPGFDLAVVRVDKVDANEARPIPLHISNPPFTADVLLPGYPNEGACAGTNMPWHGTPQLVSTGSRNFDYASLETYGGMSGGPLLRVIDRVLVSLGHHNRGEDNGEQNRALRYDEFVKQRVYNDWLNIQAM